MASRSPKRTRSTWTKPLIGAKLLDGGCLRASTHGQASGAWTERTKRGGPEEVPVRGFSLTVDQLAPNVMRVALRGELDLSRPLLLDSELQAVEAMRPDALVIDLRELDFVDSSGIARLIGARRRAMRGGWQLLVVRGGETVSRVMSLSAIDRALRLIDDPSEALAAVAT